MTTDEPFTPTLTFVTPGNASASDPYRNLWLDEFETDEVQVLNGDPWPMLVVHRWQRNRLGERRFVETRRYVRAEVSTDARDAA